jgi:hypothetical protein
MLELIAIALLQLASFTSSTEPKAEKNTSESPVVILPTTSEQGGGGWGGGSI